MALIKCSECGRDISDRAPACPGCGASVLSSGTGEAAPVQSSRERASPTKTREVIGVVLLLVPAAAALLLYFWISGMNLLQNPTQALNAIVGLTIVATAALAAIEASQLGIGAGGKESGPIAWFFFVALLWVIGYPAYLWSRSKHGAKNLAAGGAIIMLMFCGVVWFMWSAIETQKDNVRKALASVVNSDEPSPTVSPVPAVPETPHWKVMRTKSPMGDDTIGVFIQSSDKVHN